MRWRLLKSHWLQWRSTFILRAQELVFWRKHKSAWCSGYGSDGARFLEYGFEALVRIAELLGWGLVFSFLESLFAGNRYRSLSPQESAPHIVGLAAFAKTCFSEEELENVLLDEGAKWIAGTLKIAFVAGYAIKTNGPYTPRLLIHELVHVRQFRRWGWAYVAKALMAQWTGAGYEVPSKLALPRTPLAFAKTRFANAQKVVTFHPALNAEQEARRLEEWVMWRVNVTKGFA